MSDNNNNNDTNSTAEIVMRKGKDHEGKSKRFTLSDLK